MKLVKKTCPNCGYIIQNYTKDNTHGMIGIGIPYTSCPSCKTILIEKNIKEKNMLTTFDYIRMWFWNIFTALILPILVLPFAGILLGFINIQNEDLVTTLIVIIYITIVVLYLGRCYKFQKQELKKSEERLKNKEYRKITEKIKKEHYGINNMFKIDR